MCQMVFEIYIMHQNVNIVSAAIFNSMSWRSYLSGKCTHSFEMGIIDQALYMRHDSDIYHAIMNSQACFGNPHGCMISQKSQISDISWVKG